MLLGSLFLLLNNYCEFIRYFYQNFMFEKAYSRSKMSFILDFWIKMLNLELTEGLLLPIVIEELE